MENIRQINPSRLGGSCRAWPQVHRGVVGGGGARAVKAMAGINLSSVRFRPRQGCYVGFGNSPASPGDPMMKSVFSPPPLGDCVVCPCNIEHEKSMVEWGKILDAILDLGQDGSLNNRGKTGKDGSPRQGTQFEKFVNFFSYFSYLLYVFLYLSFSFFSGKFPFASLLTPSSLFFFFISGKI